MSEAEIKKVIFALHQAGLVELVRKTAASAPSQSSSRRRRKKVANQPDKKVINKLIDKLKSI
jgi:hypothetical protein